jgi:hypothetical protein
LVGSDNSYHCFGFCFIFYEIGTEKKMKKYQLNYSDLMNKKKDFTILVFVIDFLAFAMIVGFVVSIIYLLGGQYGS